MPSLPHEIYENTAAAAIGNVFASRLRTVMSWTLNTEYTEGARLNTGNIEPLGPLVGDGAKSVVPTHSLVLHTKEMSPVCDGTKVDIRNWSEWCFAES